MRAVPASRYLAFFSIAVGGCALDLATKRWIFAWLGNPAIQCPQPRGAWWLWPGVIGFETSLNEGALFGMGQGMGALFAALSLVAALGILWWLFWVGAARQWLLAVALACVMAGVLGNLYDRLGLPGLVWKYDGPLHQAGGPVHAVRDWILVLIGRWHYPTFNVADSLLVCGAALMIYHALWTRPEENPS